eukprot:GFKZ01010058.1.p1 GENE.GFKZ01010058.1~~GFKZ01010058.1.p1  ORF type:complete len:589 (+),score=97.61 GFKZ01010058.1:148-1914(+)
MNALTDISRLIRAATLVARAPIETPLLQSLPPNLIRLALCPRIRPPPSPQDTSLSSPSPIHPSADQPTDAKSEPSLSSEPAIRSTPGPPPSDSPPSPTQSANPTATPVTATPASPDPTSDPQTPPPSSPVSNSWTPRQRRVPESPFSRVLAFGGLGVGLMAGAAAESARRFVGLSTPDKVYSSFVSEANAERLAASLSRMRGAALKLGQMLSIQDENVVPEAVLKALERVRQGADVMPERQLETVLEREWGEGWRERLVRFEMSAMAAASIGQVHEAEVLDGGENVRVCVKVQYPGVGGSIRSDLSNLKRLVVGSGVIPENFFVGEALKVAEEELERECDYEVERANQERYRELVDGEGGLGGVFSVPRTFEEWSTKRVLMSEYVDGVPIDRVGGMSQDVKDRVGESLLRLVLVELFVFGFQQSDPNWSNYLYEERTGKIHLIDFGAARGYNEGFLMQYLSLIRACANRDREGVVDWSIRLGFLTGEESREMVDAHVQASFAVGEPFQKEYRETGFDFKGNDIPARAAKFGKVMLQHRLTPPPKEAYALHRRLSGGFLMSMKLGARINAARLLDDMVERLIREGRIEE